MITRAAFFTVFVLTRPCGDTHRRSPAALRPYGPPPPSNPPRAPEPRDEPPRRPMAADGGGRDSPWLRLPQRKRTQRRGGSGSGRRKRAQRTALPGGQEDRAAVEARCLPVSPSSTDSGPRRPCCVKAAGAASPLSPAAPRPRLGATGCDGALAPAATGLPAHRAAVLMGALSHCLPPLRGKGEPAP